MKRKFKKLAASMLCASMMCTGISVPAGAGTEEADRIESIIASMTLEEKAGQMIMADFRTWNENPGDEKSEPVPVTELREEIRDAIARDRFGGIILFAENCSENEKTVKLVNDMQKANQDTKGAFAVPLLIAADQEGGAIARLGQGTRWIGNMALTAAGDPQNAFLAAECIGEELSALGINTDFAPVLDVNNNPANPVIGIRSFSDDPQIVSKFGISFLLGLRKTGTITSLKHFPGHGDVATDSHTGFPILDKSYEDLKKCELIPFKAAIEAGADMVMTAHIQYPQIEKKTYTSVSTGKEVYLPATLSHTILTDILRGDMGFDGVIVSDALNMAAIADHFDRADVCTLAIEAGIDLFLMPVPVTDTSSLEELEKFIASICENVKNGTIPESRIDESVRRILTLKADRGLLDRVETDLTEEQQTAAEESVGSAANHNLEWEIMQKAAVLIKNEEGLLPVKVQSEEKVLVLYSGSSRTATAEVARLHLVQEGLIPEDVSFDTMVYSRETREECLKAVQEADHVIAVSTIFGAAELDPESEDGADCAVLDEVIGEVHKEGKKLVLVSGYLPYDTARYTDADAIIAVFGSAPMRELPKGKNSYSVNIPAALCGIFGEYEFTGKLPVNIPKLNDHYQFTDEILYPRAVSADPEKTPEWQGQVTFPDWKGYTDDTLAMNSTYSFFGYHGQGTIYVQTKEEVKDFRMYVNGVRVDTDGLTGGEMHSVDISDISKDGTNTVQISNIIPFDLSGAVTVSVPYPVILPGTPAEEGISQKALEMISDLIECDIENGFTSAQLSVVKNGRLVYENAWGKTNTYLPDGSTNENSADVTTDTLYDLASVTKMFSVNYALQKLTTDGEINLDDPITKYLGEEFAQNTELPADSEADLETIKAWKAKLTICDLLRHQGGFAADPRYCAPVIYVQNLAEGESYPENPYFAGNGADEATRQATIEAIFKTALEYEPGTKTLYSDLDYMILGLVVEKVTGQDLDSWLKETFYIPMGLTHITYNPLKAGFLPDDCAATELNGNTRDGVLDFEGYRTYTLQGEVHDEKAWYSMMGVSGHAGLFGTASDLAKLGSVMLSGGYGDNRFFSENVMNQFTAPKKEDAGNWGLGWWRQGDSQRVWYFGTQASANTIGHQGWTGTLIMIDPERRLVIAYLTNKINSPVTDKEINADRFNGNWYTAGTLGFVPQILSMGMDTDQDISAQLVDLSADMAVESLKLVPETVELMSDHPSARNVRSKLELFERTIKNAEDTETADLLRNEITEAFEKVRSDHKPDFGRALTQVIVETEDGSGPADDSSACYMAFLKALSAWDTDGQISEEAWAALNAFSPEEISFAALLEEMGAGETSYLGNKESYENEEDCFAAWDQLSTGDFLEITWKDKTNTEEAGGKEVGTEEAGGEEKTGEDTLTAFFLKRAEAFNSEGERDDVIYYWTSLGSSEAQRNGYGIGKTRMSEIDSVSFSRVTYPGAFRNMA